MEYGQSDTTKNWTEKSSSVAPALIGAAAGVLLGDMMSGRARRPVAFSLFALGLAALTPSVAGAVKKKVTGPTTRRGSRRTLASIRDGGLPTSEVDIYSDEMGI